MTASTTESIESTVVVVRVFPDGNPTNCNQPESMQELWNTIADVAQSTAFNDSVKYSILCHFFHNHGVILAEMDNRCRNQTKPNQWDDLMQWMARKCKAQATFGAVKKHVSDSYAFSVGEKIAVLQEKDGQTFWEAGIWKGTLADMINPIVSFERGSDPEVLEQVSVDKIFLMPQQQHDEMLMPQQQHDDTA